LKLSSIIAFIIIILLPIDNLQLQLYGIRIRFSEILGLLLLIYLLFSSKKQAKLTFPPKTKYLLLFFLLSSVSLLYADSIQFGVKFQIHQLILLLTIVAVYNVFILKGYRFDFERLESNLFVFFDFILIYGLLQLFLFNVLGLILTFGMDNWRDAALSYRQDIINPFLDAFENAPWMRPSSVFAEPVFLGLFCTWLFVVSFISYLKGNKKFANLFRLIASALLLVFIASRSALIAVSGALLLYFIFSSNEKIKILKKS